MHEQPSRPHPGREPGAEHPGGEPDDALLGDGQAGHERGIMEHLLAVERQDEHLTTTPDTEQQDEGTALAQARQPQHLAADQRVGPMAFDRGAVGQGEPGGDGLLVAADAVGELSEYLSRGVTAPRMRAGPDRGGLAGAAGVLAR
jgi:hypothetical protein